MTPHYWQLFASHQTDLLLLPPLTETRLGFRSGAITGARYPNKTKASVVSRSRTVNLPHGNLVLSGVSISSSPNSIFLAWRWPRVRVSRVFQRIGILRLMKGGLVDTSVLPRCYNAFVLPILEYCSPVWGSAAECHLQLLECQVCSVARLCPDQNFLSLSCQHRVAWLSMLYKVNSNSNHCLFSELPSASTRIRHTRAAAAAH